MGLLNTALTVNICGTLLSDRISPIFSANLLCVCCLPPLIPRACKVSVRNFRFHLCVTVLSVKSYVNSHRFVPVSREGWNERIKTWRFNVKSHLKFSIQLLFTQHLLDSRLSVGTLQTPRAWPHLWQKHLPLTWGWGPWLMDRGVKEEQKGS